METVLVGQVFWRSINYSTLQDDISCFVHSPHVEREEVERG